MFWQQVLAFWFGNIGLNADLQFRQVHLEDKEGA